MIFFVDDYLFSELVSWVIYLFSGFVGWLVIYLIIYSFICVVN